MGSPGMAGGHHHSDCSPELTQRRGYALIVVGASPYTDLGNNTFISFALSNISSRHARFSLGSPGAVTGVLAGGRFGRRRTLVAWREDNGGPLDPVRTVTIRGDVGVSQAIDSKSNG